MKHSADLPIGLVPIPLRLFDEIPDFGIFAFRNH